MLVGGRIGGGKMVGMLADPRKFAGVSLRLPLAASLVVFLAVPFAVEAQKLGTPPRVNPSVVTTTKPNPNNTADNTSTSGMASMYIDGKVAVQDGSELPLNVVIEKICGSRRSALGYVDRKGNFSVQLAGSSLASLVDASDNSRDSLNGNIAPAKTQGGSPLMGCEIQAVYPGYRSPSIDIGSQRLMDNPNIGTLIIRRIATGEGTTVSQTMLTAPKGAVKAYEQGMESVRKGDLASAVRNFEKAVALHPTFANAWYELGHLSLARSPETARADFEKALAADSKYLPPYSDLALLAYHAKNWQETVKITDRGLRLDSSGTPDLYYYNAAAQYNQKNLDEAEKKAREAIKVDFSHSIPKAPQLLSFILAAKSDYAGAVEQMQVYLGSGLGPQEAERSRRQLAVFQSKADETAKK
jgi:tetratricopeptide (TPR) repeat protein